MLLITGLFAQFSKGTISAGALFNYSSSEDENENSNQTSSQTAIGTKYTSSRTIQPTFSYFVQSNLSIDGYIGLNSLEEEYCYEYSYSGGNEECDDFDASANILGVGGTFYVNNFYGGGGYARISSESGDYESIEKYLEVHGGYLHNLTQNVYLDIGFSRLSGMGEIESEYDGVECDDNGNDCDDNEYSQFDFKVGIKAFFTP